MIGVWLACVLFGLLLIMLEAGRRLGMRHRDRYGEAYGAGLGAVEGAVFGLLGLIVAFTFSGAATRFDERRALIVEEANDIGTAWLRLDLLPAASQPEVREKMRQYVDARIAVYRALPDIEAAREHVAQSVALQGQIWRLAVASSRPEAAPGAGVLLLPALNSMFDISTTRTWAGATHPPFVIFALLFLLVLFCALFAGHGMAAPRRNWLHMIGFALVLAGAVFVIADIEYPRLGLISLTDFDQAIVGVRKSME